ncbi:MAG: hypothetical protein EB034_14320, partial [Verrucomicrobia bacterium]|nr:hypothetical protein [Verrucomicrobiota bacterium]
MDIPLPAAVAAVAGNPTTRARLVLGHEAGFANLVVEPGAQTVFTRIRVDIRDLPYSGTYRITTPYKILVVSNAVAATRLFLTEDVGLTPPPASEANFNLSLHSKYGPYLLPSNTRGGAELPPVTFEGRSYIADAARIGKITGSPLGPQTNVFRIECWDYVRNNGIPVLDPAGNPIVTKLLDTEVDDFTLTGRIKTDTIPDYVKIDRASYFNSPTDKRVDVFVTSPASLTNRLPAQPFSTLVARPITLYPAPPQTNTLITGTTVLAPPAGVPGIVMARNGSSLFAQSPQIKTGIFPQEVTVMDGIGAIYRARVTDSLYISTINYSPASQTLSVESISSDTVTPPVLSLSGVETTAPTIFQNGVLNLTGLAAVPNEVGIVSSYGAEGLPAGLTLNATTGVISGTPTKESAADPLAGKTILNVSQTGNDTTGNGSTAAPFATIQKAIDSASNGNVVLVGPGTFSGTGNTNLNLRGKQIIVKSSAGPDQTILDLGRQKGVSADSTETLDTVIDGFTFKNGYVQSGADWGGDAIVCTRNQASLKIKNCIFTLNETKATYVTTNMQIVANRSSSASIPQVENCLFFDNTVGGGGWTSVGGGSASVIGGFDVFNCTIANNTLYSSASSWGGYAGGIRIAVSG